MPEGLMTAAGESVDLDDSERVFAAAMAAPSPDSPEFASPPKKDPDAPWGYKADGTAKKAPGRPRKDTARVQAGPVPAPAAPSKPKLPGKPKDYAEELTGLVQLSWGLLATFSPADAAAVKIHGPGMVKAWNQAAQENAMVAKGIDWLTSGGVWGAVVMATAPFALQVAANHGAKVPALGGMGMATPDQLAEMTRADLEEMAAEISKAA
jgi:predicted flap endonuclease-1-like 5' DNA nuclease